MTTSSILLVDKRIQDHETIVAAVKADGVRCIVFDVTDIDAQGGASASSASFEYILDKIADLGATSFSNIGIVQHNTGAPFHRFFAETQGEESTVAAVETADPTLQTWAGFAAFITTLKTTYGVQNVDLMACALYSDPNWKYIIDTLVAQTGVTIRASTDDTGAAALGGDWFLESHTGVNLKDVYFTEAIEEFRGVLYYSNRYDSRTQQTAKSFAPGSAFGWGYSYYGGDTSINTTGGSLSSDIIAVYGNSYAMAALRTGGSVVTWGDNSSGAAQQKWASGAVGSVAGSLSSGVTKLYMNTNAMSALKTDGTVITWGNNSYGGDSSTVTLTSVVDIYSNQNAFAALKSNGSVVTWGSTSNGSDSSAVSSSISSNVVSVNMAYRAGAALKKNGSVITWGSATYGGNSSSVTSDLSSGVVVVYTDNEYSYAALNNNGRVITWGYSTGYILSSSVNLTNTVSVFSNTSGGYAALKLDGSVVTWGDNAYGGDSTGKGLSTAKIVSIYGGSSGAFAALTSTGNVITWGYGPTGGNSSAVSASLTNVVAIYSNSYAFAALKNNGQVITWGNSSYGGTSTSVSNDISANVVAVYSTSNAFAALRKDGKTIVWGDITYGGAFNAAIAGGGSRAVVGGDLNSGIVSINNTSFGFAAIQNTTATTFDLSASYYTDNDRYDILRNKENRRRVNLTTLNNNVFTLSSARDIERFNYTIPSGVGLFRIIVPDFVDSSYSITSTASIPGGASINYIIACEEGEPVTISGTTYINYGAFVYRRNADNTFTKMPSVAIDGLTYNAYGGDGINSSGIALRYRLGAFTVPSKTAGDASFNLTAPVSDSSGAFTYTSSNTNVATVTSGGEVTIVAAGTTTVTATQAASGSWPADSITASLVVSKLTSTLGELTVPAKIPSDAPFALTAPTSTISSIISPVNTITSPISIILPPTLDVSAVVYGNTWGQIGSDITGFSSENSFCSLSANGRVMIIGSPNSNSARGYVYVYDLIGSTWTLRGSIITGQAIGDYFGSGVSISANGNIIAIAASRKLTNAGQVRIYAWSGTSWVQRGEDINGEAIDSYSGNSGLHISLSADGAVVAIGANANDGSGNLLPDVGHVRVYRYVPSKTVAVTEQSNLSFGPVGWTRMGGDIDGEATLDESGKNVSVSADGTTVAIGAYYNDGNGNNSGHVRVYRYNSNKTNPVTDQSLSTFGPAGWDRLGADIDGEVAGDGSGWGVNLSTYGNTLAIGAQNNNGGRGQVRVYDLSGNSWIKRGLDIDGEDLNSWSGLSVSMSADTNTLIIGAYANSAGIAGSYRGHARIYIWNSITSAWQQSGTDIDGTATNEFSGWCVCISADGTTVSIISLQSSGTADAIKVRVFIRNVSNAITYSSSSSSIADVCGNLLLIKGVNGTSTITATQNGNTYTGRLDVSGTTYTLQYNPFTYTISDASLATVSTYGTVTLTGTAVGTSTITATQPETLNYASRSVSGSLVVSLPTPTIGALSAPAKNFGDASFNLTAPTSNSSGAFTYTSSNTAVATVTSGGTVTVVGVGSTTITATQAATTNYTSGSVTASLVVSAIAPTIGALSAPAKNFGDASFNLTAPTSNSGGAFTYTSSNTAVATVTSGGTVTIIGAGSTTITASQAATTNYTSGSVTASLVVSAIAPTIGALSAPAKNFGDASFNMTAPTSNSGGAFTYTSSNTAVATVTSGGTVTVVGAGSTTITASQASTTNYTGGSVTASLVVSPIAPTIGALTAPAKNFGASAFDLTAPTSNSDGAITYTSSAPAVATVTSGGTVTVVGAGTTSITASQASTTNYTSGSVTASLVVSSIAPTIGALTAPAKNFGDASFNLTAPTSNSDGAITYTSSAPGVATVTSGGTVTVVGAGTTTITATQAATTNYTSGSVTASLVVSSIAPTIGALTAPAKNFGDASFNLTAPTSNSGGAFTYESSDSAVATVTSGGTVTVVGAGSTTITATQASTTNYTSGSVTASLVVSAIAPTIGALSAPAKNFGDASFNLTAPSSNSDGAFTYESTAPGVATVTSGGLVTIIGAGSTTITATQASTTNYTSGSVTASLVISAIAPTYQSISQITKIYSTDVSFSLTSVMSGVSNSSGAYTFSTTSAAIDICGGVATILAYTPSAITITATQAASGNYNGAGSTTFAVLVNRKVPSYGAFSVPAATYEDAPFSIAAHAPTTDSAGVPFTYTSSEPTVATINSDGTVITIIGQGYTTITASQDASGNYAASSTTTSFLVNRAAPTFLKAFTIPNKTFGDASFSLLPFTEGLDNTDGTYHFTSSNAQLVSISEVDGVTATILAYTPTPITIYVAIDACGNYAASSTSGTLTVARAAPTIGALTVPAKNFGDASFNLTDPSSNSGGAFTYTSSAPGVATVTSTGGTVTVVGAGSTTITATQAASGNYLGGSSVTASLVVSAIAPTIGALSAPAKNFGDASFNLASPTSNSGGAFTYTSSAPGVATVTSGGTVTVVGAGSTTITATQAASADGNYTGGSVTATLVVSSIAPTIGALTAPAKNFGDASFNLTAPTSNSGGAFTYTSSAPGVATVTSGGTVTVVGAGTTTITASQASTTNYTGGSVTASLVVSSIAPTIGALTAPAKNFGASAFDLTAPTSNSDGAFIYTSSAPAVATVTSGGTVTVVGAGTTTITATQASTTNYTSGSVTASLVVSSIAPTIGGLTAPAKNFGDASFNLTAPTSNSDGAITYTSSAPAVATVTSGGTVTVVGAGTTTITATQASTTNYTSGSVTASLVVSAIAPTIGALTAPAKNFGASAFDLTAPSSNSNGAITYTSSAPGVATVTSGGTVTVVGAGTTTITATQAATTNYTGGSVTASLVVSPIAPTIGALTAPAKNFGASAFDLTAPTSNSGGAFTYESSDSAVATVTSGGTVTVVGAGSTTITATQASTTNYTSGSSVTASLVVSAIAPTIGALTAPAKNFGDASFNLTAPTSNSGGAITYTSSAPGVATVTSGGTVTIVGAGSTTITATQAASADGNYTGGSSVTASLVVSAIAPTYQSISQITKIYSTDVSFSLTSVMSGVSNSDGAYTFSSTSAAIDICGGVATILAYTPSAITITATQAASGNYNGAGSTTFTVLVNRKVPSYGAFSVPAATYEDAPFSIAAYAPTTDSTGVSFTYTSSEPTVATINSDGTVITIIGQGYTTITASQAAGGNYAASSTTTSFLVNRAAPTFLKAFTITNKTFGDASFSLLPFTEGLDNTDGTYHFTSSNAQLVSISEVDGVTATILAYTPTPITIYVAIDACGNYAASSTSGTLTVARAAPTIGALTVPAKNFGDASFNLTAPTSDSSGGAFTYTSSAPGVATVTSTGGTVTVVGAGSTTITATQAANGNYAGGSSVTASLVVSAIAPTIGALSAPAKNFGDASFNLTAPTSNSGGAFTYTSSAPGVATVTSTGGTVTIVGAGSTTITATQAASADGNYTGGSSVTASLVVSASLSNFTVPTGKVYGDASFNLTDPSTIDNTVGFTFTSGNSAVATISGRTVTIVGAGSSVITASQAATENRAQMDISATLVVARASVVITLAAITKTYGDAQFSLAPTSTNTDDASGAALSFTSSNTGVASIVDTSFVSINGVGAATITIAIAATANFTDGSGSVVVTVNKGTPTLSTLSVSANKTYGSAPFSILTAPTSASAGAITYSSSDTGIATIDNSGVITLLAAGYVNFTATQAATALYNSATKTSNTMTVHRQSILLTRDSPSVEVVNKTYGDEYFIVSATNAATGGALTYESDTPSVAGVINASTGVISVVSVGTATITATRAQTAQYTSVPVSWTVQVARATTTLTGLSNLTRNVTVAPFAVTASSASDGAVTYALQDPSSTVLVIHPTTGVITLRAPGSAVIVASQAQGTLYEAPNSITATITVNAVGNALQGATLTSTANFSNVNLNGANMNNVNIVGSNFAGAVISDATLTGATITGATFTNASLVNADLSGATLTGTNFTNADLSGATLTGANVANVNFTNTNIKGANITDVSFSSLQKLQLLKKSDNRDIASIAVSSVSGPTILAAISASSPARTIANLDLSNLATTVAVIIPETSTTPDAPITDISLDVVNNTIFYLPINENEYFRINNIVYYSSSGVIRKYTTNEIIEVITYNDKPVWLVVGSIIGLVLQTNTMNASSFVVPSTKLSTDTEPFMPTTLPTSNSNSPIVYSSSSTHLATINATTGEITITGNGNGIVSFTATQVQNATYGPATITSNTLLIDQYLHFSLVGLNQSFNLTTLASLETLNLIADTTDATAVFYVRLSDMTDIFKYQSDSADVNDISATDLKYYVFHRKWPAELKINPSHAMLNKADSAGILGTAQLFAADKALVKHDFVRYLALKLFNTIHGVDLFVNETDLQENATYYGESIRHNIHEIMSGISTTSGDESMAYDASGNKYLTNSASGNTNLCRELMRQIAASVASRFYNNGADNTGMKTVPLREEDTITFKVTIQAAATQNVLTGVSEIPSRSYTIKMVLKSSVTSVTNANTVIADSEMFPNSYPYSSSVTSIAPDSESAATVYNIYSPPAPIPFSRFGFNGWYYTNSSAWVGVNSGVRNHVKWLIPANRVGSSTVGALQYVRVNLKIHNKTAVPYLMVYTQSGSWRKYIVSGGGNSLVNGTKYSFYMNFNSYSREPAMIGYTNKDLVISLGTGAFAGNEVITNIALETDSGASAGAVEFTLASVMVGEIASGVPSEKEYGFLAEVPSAYP